jgi:dihydroorotate dehydrogenase (fumarate)
MGVTFENPLMPASGPLVDTLENLEYFNNSTIGGLVTKTISVEAAQVPKPCIVATKHMVYNTELWSEKHHSIWLKEILPQLVKVKKKPLFISIGYTAKDAEVLVPKLEPFADFFEVSTHYGKDELGSLVSAITSRTDKPLFIKLSPHVEHYIDFIQTAVDHGAAGVVAVNSVGPGLVIDLNKRAVKLGLSGGQSWISGPAIKPIALNRVMNIRKAFPDLPIISAGGVETAEDVLEFVLAGADLVQMLSSGLIHGRTIYDKIVADLPKMMDKYNIDTLENLRKAELSLEPQGKGGFPEINHETCTSCKLCVRNCPEMALSFTDKVIVDTAKCARCGLCESRCPVEAISGVL